jgi:hypothetical protein
MQDFHVLRVGFYGRCLYQILKILKSHSACEHGVAELGVQSLVCYWEDGLESRSSPAFSVACLAIELEHVLVGVLMFRLRQQFYVVRLLPLRDACDLCGVHTLELWEVTHGLRVFSSFFLLCCFYASSTLFFWTGKAPEGLEASH